MGIRYRKWEKDQETVGPWKGVRGVLKKAGKKSGRPCAPATGVGEWSSELTARASFPVMVVSCRG